METSTKAKPKIAWLSPFPPQRSGIANYSFWLVKALRPHLNLHLYVDGGDAGELGQEFQIYPLSAFVEQHEGYDDAVYHIGNNSEFHKEIYKLAWNFPATTVLHDYDLSGFMHHAFHMKTDWRLYEKAREGGNQHEKTHRLQAMVQHLGHRGEASPMSHALVHRSKRVVVHHRWVKNQFASRDHIEVIPLATKITDQPGFEQIAAFKKKFQISDDDFIITCCGFINANKLPELQVAVLKQLLGRGYPVHLVFAGELAPDVRYLEGEVQRSGLSQSVTFTGYLDEPDYRSAIYASDVAINLRKPSMGEASLTLMQSLAAGRPTIVSDVNQYREFPDRVCWKVPHDANEAETLFAYLAALLSNKNVRTTLSENSINYVKNVFAVEKVVPHWLRLFQR